MPVIVNKETRIMVQGITGTEGRLQTAAMLAYGTNVVAGVTPGKGGQKVEGVPVFDSVAEAVKQRGADTSILYVPARTARAGVEEAVEAGIQTIIVITEGIPQLDSIQFIARAARKGANIIGPNCSGLICPSLRIKAGIMPGQIFKPGPIGIVSRSGTLTYEIAWALTGSDIGQSTCVGIGGDPISGLDYIRVLEMFKDDSETRAVILIGEIGGNAEERAAQYIAETRYPKPVAAFIAGKTAPPGKRMGHAGAIILGGAGSAESKLAAFAAAGVPVADKPRDIIRLLKL